MLAPYNKEVRQLKEDNPNLQKKIDKAFDKARKGGNESHVEIPLDDDKTLEIVTFGPSTSEFIDFEDQDQGDTNIFDKAWNSFLQAVLR